MIPTTLSTARNSLAFMACMQANKSEKVIASTETTMQQQPVLS
jgi:peptide-methionine (R)-S-oxide reductase